MARRISILSFLVALTIIVSFYGRDAYAQRTFSAYSVEELNKILAGEEIREMTLAVNDRVSFTQDFRYDYDDEYRYIYNDYVPRSSPYISLQNHVFMYGQPETDTLVNFRIDINLLGQGIWRLQALPDGTPNTTNLRAGAEVVFHVGKAGTLELMQGSTITLYEPMNSFAKFSLESPQGDSDNRVTLNLRGTNVIDASFFELGHNSSLGFDLTNANDAEPILHMIARHIYGTVGNPSDPTYNSTDVEINLLGFKHDPGSSLSGSNVRLIYEDVPLNGARFYYNPIDANENDNNRFFLVRGENWNVVKDASGGRLTGRIAMTAPEDYERVADNLYRRIIHIDGFTSLVGVVNWTGAENNYWNATTQNWTGMQNYLTDSTQQNHTFLHGDRVLFTQAGAGTVYVNHGGVQIGDIDSSNFDDSRTNPGMIVESGVYTFVNLEYQGQSGSNPIINDPAASIIGIDGPGSVLITAPKLGTGNSYDWRNAAQVTLRSPNSYWGGTTVENGARLTLRNTGAVGTGLLNLKYNSDDRVGATLVFDIEKTDPGIPSENFKSVFYNILNTAAGTTVVKTDYYDLTLERNIEDAANDNIINNKADTIIEHGILRKYIPTGVLTVNKGAAYHTLGYFEDVNNFIENPDEPEPKVQSRYYAAAEENSREAMYHDRLIAGLKDGDDGGGTVDMNAFLLTINTTGVYDEFAFSGLITGIGSVTSKNGIASTGGKVEKAGVGVQIFENAHNEYPGGTDIAAGTLVGSHVLTKNMSDYQPFGSGGIRINQGALLAFELTGDTPALYAATLHNAITGAGDLHVGYDRINEDPNLGPEAQILHLLSSDSDYTGQTLVKKGKLRASNVHSTGLTREVLLSQENTAIQFIGMNDSSVDNPYDRIINGEGGVEVLQNDPDAMSSTDEFEPTRVYLRSYNYDKDLNNDGIYDPTPMEERSSYTGITIVRDGKAGEETELHLLDAQATGKTIAVNLEGAYSTLVLDFAPLENGEPDEQEQFYDRYITGNGNLIKDSEGIAVLTKEDPTKPDNDYKGYTLIRQGTLKLDYAAGTGVSVSGGGGAVTIDKDAILELAFDGRYEKNIDGRGILAKSGAGTITTLGGISTYTGGTHLYSGTLSYNNLDPTVPGNLGKGTITFMNGGGILQNRSEVTEFTEQVLIHAGSTATFDTQADLIIIGDKGISHVDEEGTGEQSHFVKKGPATLTIDTTLVNWTGSTTVEEGILKNNIPNGTVLTVNSGAAYHTGNANRTVSALWGGGSVVTTAGKNFTVDYNGTDTDDFEGTITGDGNLVKIGKGVFELSGYNDYTGSTLVDNGVLVGNIAKDTALTVMSTGEYRAGNSTRQISSLQGGGLVDMQGQSLVINQNRTNFTPNFQGIIQNGDWLTKTGIGTQIFSGREYTFKGNVDLREGFLQIGGSSSQTYFRTAGDMKVRPDGGLYLDSRGKVEIGQLFDVEGTLKVNLGTGIITARDVTIGTDAVLNVAGISSSDKEVVIIRSTNDIQGDFLNVTVAGESSGVDFLDFGVGKSTDKKEIYVGQTLTWYRNNNAHGTFTLNNAEGTFNVDVSLNDVTDTFDPNVWDGKTLTKKGPGKLILSAVNNYTGATIVEAGTLMLTNENATLGSKEIDLVNESSSLELDYSSLSESGAWTKGLTTSITGEGSVYKTGKSIAVLGGNHTFSGQTFVNGGVLLLDGSSRSQTWVRSDAGFGGNGTLDNKLIFENESHYYWRFDGTASGSDHLTVNSSVHIGDGVAFKPVPTVSQEKLENFSSLTVISTLSGVYGRFDGIVAGTNPFYMYELDYSDPRKVKISGFLRDEPLPLSDIVAASLTMAQTRMYRTAYQQIQREWMSECPHHGHARTGQQASKRTAWMNFIGRGGDLASSYFASDYSFQSYGVQAGLSLVSNCNRSAGILFGREENKLSNHSDKVEGEDHYLGFYYGQVFSNGYDFKGYIGGGWQKNRLERTSNGYRYATRYNGNTYNTNFEFGRRFLGDRNWLLRPFAGFDLNVTWNDKSMENSLDLAGSNEYRGYGKSDLAQVFLRAGIEATKTWERLDFRMGTQIRWNVADSKGSTKIYYPALDGTAVRSSVTGYSSDLGRFEWGFNFGLNWFITERRNTLVFLDFDGDLFADRPGDPLHGTGTVGFVWRF